MVLPTVDVINSENGLRVGVIVHSELYNGFRFISRIPGRKSGREHFSSQEGALPRWLRNPEIKKRK
jgi:hypothetical protein